jgi:hypothetical protein
MGRGAMRQELCDPVIRSGMPHHNRLDFPALGPVNTTKAVESAFRVELSDIAEFQLPRRHNRIDGYGLKLAEVLLEHRAE